MLTKEKIKKLFERLNEKLAERGEFGEIGIVGGTVMCLVQDARKSTRDVGAIFKPAALIRKIAKEISEEFKEDPDWLNDGAKGYIQGEFQRIDVLNESHLRVWMPDPKYLLAMKCLSARWDSLDRQDVKFLIARLKIKRKEDVFFLIEGYFPKGKIPEKTQFFIEELFE